MPLFALPTELIAEIFYFSNAKDLEAFRFVCRRWNAILQFLEPSLPFHEFADIVGKNFGGCTTICTSWRVKN